MVKINMEESGESKIKVFDMFAGYGGAEFALKKAGIEELDG